MPFLKMKTEEMEELLVTIVQANVRLAQRLEVTGKKNRRRRNQLRNQAKGIERLTREAHRQSLAASASDDKYSTLIMLYNSQMDRVRDLLIKNAELNRIKKKLAILAVAILVICFIQFGL